MTAAGIGSTLLTEIAAGTVPPDLSSPQPTTEYLHPGLAAEPNGGRAFVIPPAGPIAEVELSTLAVSYRAIGQGASRMAATPSDGGGGPIVYGGASFRQAAWVGNGLVAVSGSDDRTDPGPDGPVQSSVPAGLALVDTTSWTLRTLDDDAASFHQTAGLLVAMRNDPWGIAVYDRAGGPAFRRTLRPATRVDVGGGHVYLTLGNEYRRHRVRVLDAHTGRVLSTALVPGWLYPLSRTSPQPCWC